MKLSHQLQPAEMTIRRSWFKSENRQYVKLIITFECSKEEHDAIHRLGLKTRHLVDAHVIDYDRPRDYKGEARLTELMGENYATAQINKSLATSVPCSLQVILNPAPHVFAYRTRADAVNALDQIKEELAHIKQLIIRDSNTPDADSFEL